MKNNEISTINVHELKKRYDESPDLCLIDVREHDEWNEMHIPGALHIPKDELINKIEVKAPDRSRPIYLHCRGGVRSLYAAHSLLEMGYQTVYSVDGGIIEWATAGYPINEQEMPRV